MHNDSVFSNNAHNTWIQHFFFHQQSICGTRYQSSVSLKVTIQICLRKIDTPNLLLDGVIFDFIVGSHIKKT